MTPSEATQGKGVPAAPSGHSAKPEPSYAVSAQGASGPNADFGSYEEWAARRDRLVALAKRTTPGFGRRYFALIEAAYDGVGHACAMVFRDALNASAIEARSGETVEHGSARKGESATEGDAQND